MRNSVVQITRTRATSVTSVRIPCGHFRQQGAVAPWMREPPLGVNALRRVRPHGFIEESAWGAAPTGRSIMSEAPGTTTPIRYPLSREDSYRVSRLYEEIQGRLEEMALIGARAGGFTLTAEMVRKFDPHQSALEADATYVEIVCPPEGLGACGCIVLMSDGNHFWERPCGSHA